MVGLSMPVTAGPHAAGRRRAATLAAALAVAVSLVTPERAAACTLTTTGAATVDDGVLFTLTLGAVSTGDGLPASWTINWGDGAIQTYAGNPASVTHTYTAWATPSIFTYNILASAVCGPRTYFKNDLVVPSAGNDKVNWYRHDAATNKALARVPAQSGPNGLNNSLDAVIGPDGRLYVSGYDSANVVRFNPTTGAFIDVFATGGTNPSGMAFGRDGHLYVGDAFLKTVRRYHGTTGAFMGDFVTAGLGGITEPEGLKFGPDGNLYVTDFKNDATTGNAVYRYNGSTGALINKFVASGAGGLRNPEDLVFGPDGNLYVASDANHNVLRFQGPSGASPGAFMNIFVVADQTKVKNAQGVAFGPDGHFYVSSFANDNVVRYNGTTGAFIDVYVSAALGGINTAEYFDFIPGHQVKVVAAAATAVELLSFTAISADGAVDLEWETGSEIDNLGFHLYRSLTEAGPFERITASLIPGLGSSPEGARYSYRDVGLVNGVTYHYQLEDVETTGKTKRHGPVSALPRAGAEPPPPGPGTAPPPGPADGSGDPGEGMSSWIRYGEPEATSLRVVARGVGHVELELRTGGFWALPEEGGGVRLQIPGFEETPQPGAPALPVMRPWVEAVAGRKVKLVSVIGRDVAAFDGLRPVVTGEPELWQAADGTLHAGERRKRPGRAFEAAGLYPEQAAELLGVAFQGDVKKAQLGLSPLRFDRSAGRLVLARRLSLRVEFTGRERDEVAGGGSRGRKERSRKTPAEGVVARLGVEAPGLYGVSFEEVFGTGGRGVSASDLSLEHQGEAVAFHVEPPPERRPEPSASLGGVSLRRRPSNVYPGERRFGPGGMLYFVSAGAQLNPYGKRAVYELSVKGGGVQMSVKSAASSGDALVPYYWQRVEQEVDSIYQGSLLTSPQRWFWDYATSGQTKSYTFPVSALAESSEPSPLSVWLQGASDFPADPDHHVRVRVNGYEVGEASWDGKHPKRIEAEVPPGVLHEGENTLALENVGDTGASSTLVLLDRYALSHPRRLVASGGTLAGRFGPWGTGTAVVQGLGSAAFVLDTTEPAGTWLKVNGALSATAGLSFLAEPDHSYLAVSPEALLRPEVTRARPSALREATNRADYLVLGPRAFLEAAQPLLDHRRAQGLETLGVPIEEVYDVFGFGEPRPEAVRDFLSHAYHHWARSPRYVLLLGDASYDFKDAKHTGVKNHVPPFLIEDSYMWTVSDPAYASVNGDDVLPDLALGRLSAQSVEQARALVDKVLAWENAGFDLAGRAVLVADNPDGAGDFEGDAESLAQSFLAGRDTQRIYLSQLGGATRDSIYEAFDKGSSLMSYMGHGAIALWASENVFNFSDVANLAPQAQQPFLMTINCLNGYFHYPFLNSLAEELVKAEGKGAIGAFAPSSLSVNWAARLYHEALLAEIASGRHERLGDALLAAQSAYADSGARPELLRVYHLLADPALRIR